MSPLLMRPYRTIGCFPRVSGDEPLGYVSEDGLTKFSPRERG